MKSQARVDQAQLIRNTDQCLAESLAQATTESEEREIKMSREIERLLNDHDNTYAHTMTSLENWLDAKSDVIMRKLDEILHGGKRQERSALRERSRQANDRDGARSYAGAQQSSRTNYESNQMEGPRQQHRGQVGQTRSRRKRMPPRRHDCPLCRKSDQCQI